MVQSDSSRKTIDLKKKVIREYIYVGCTILVSYLLLLVTQVLMGDKTGLDYIGEALAIVLLLRLFQAIAVIIFFVVNPIKILISYKSEFKNIVPTAKRVLSIIATLLPVFVSILIIFSIPIQNYIFKEKYLTGKNAYSLTYDEYKSPNEFKEELDRRGFIYNASFELSRLNKKYGNFDQSFSKYYYEEATVMTLPTKLNSFYDKKDENNVITFDSSEKAPGYIYNTILSLYSKNEDLKYVPVSRYNKDAYASGNFFPYFEDYYIECKIIYIDNDTYAIIGVGQSYDVFKYFDNKRESYKPSYTYPYHMIISEKDTIITFVDGKYYPDGAIVNEGDTFTMLPNNNKRPWSEFYEVRKVDKVNIVTINQIAKELQNGVLKESIDYHFNQQ